MKNVLTALLCGVMMTGTATAQTGAGGLGGLGGLLGGALPNVASASAGNAAGLLGYCIKNNVLGGNGAASVLGKLTGKQGVAASPGFEAGRQGELQAGDTALSLDSLKGRVKTQVCSMVLKRAQSFL